MPIKKQRGKTLCRKLDGKQIVILTGHRVSNRKSTPRRKTRRIEKSVLVLKELNPDDIPLIDHPHQEAPCESHLDDVQEVPNNETMCMSEPSHEQPCHELPILQNQTDTLPLQDKCHEDHIPQLHLQQESRP